MSLPVPQFLENASLSERLLVAASDELKRLHPATFAFVMATGILSLAARLLHLPVLPEALFALNIPAFILLWILTFLRAGMHGEAFLRDWQDHSRGPGFFTTVAATSVIGMQFSVLRGNETLALGLWWVALVLWAFCMYAVFAGLTIKEPKPSFTEGINGGWLAAVVATQSLVTLGCLVWPRISEHAEATPFLLITLWLAGGMLYIWMISLIFYRYTFFQFLPTDLLPPYWINMGAMAISALAGALLIKRANESALLGPLLPFLKGFTLLYWATATWWIPMLLILGLWRHVSREVPLTYDSLYWGAVFPLGMYTACTIRLSEALELPFLMGIPRFFIAPAMTAWFLTFLGFLFAAARALARASRPAPLSPEPLPSELRRTP